MPIITSDASMQKAGRGLRIVGVVYAVLLILAGLFALAAPVVATLAAAAVAGLMLILGGVVGLLGAASERGRHLWLQVLWSVLALGVGVWMLVRPGEGALSLTLLLGVVLAARGVASLVLSFDRRFDKARAWLAIGGGVSLVLGLMLLFNLPWIAAVALGTIVGVDFLVSGLTLLIAAIAGRPAVIRAPGAVRR